MSDHEAKAREILEKIDSDRFRSDIHPAQARDEHIGAIANALAEATEREREACAKLAKEISEGAEAGYKENHCKHCRDGEIASHNTGYFIVNAIRARGQSQ